MANFVRGSYQLTILDFCISLGDGARNKQPYHDKYCLIIIYILEAYLAPLLSGMVLFSETSPPLYKVAVVHFINM